MGLSLPGAPVWARGADAPDAADVAAQKQQDAYIASEAVAERLVANAQQNLTGPIDEQALRQSAALIEAAHRLVPEDPRYLRLLVNARIQLHDVPGQIKAWTEYRALEPDDRLAQVRLIDLYATQIQTADGREKYLASLLDRAGIADEVKSYVATEAAKLLLNRSEAQAAAMADRAVKFYPLPEAVVLQYQLLDKNATASKRFAGLLAILRVDPVQASALGAAAELLSRQGLASDAKSFYSAAVDCLRKQGVAPDHSLLLDYAASLYLSGSDKLAEAWADDVLSGRPDDVDFQFFKLTVLKQGTKDPAPVDAVSAARDALANRWIGVNNTILSLEAQPPATGQPVVPPDPTEAANKLAQMQPSQQTQQMKDAFMSAMVDMAWLELYYANKPDDAQRWIDALKIVAPPGMAAVERLEGWYALKIGKPMEAAQHFNAIKGNDVLTELGVILVARSEGTPNTLKTAHELKDKLLSAHYDGLLDTIIHQALAAEVMPPPPPGLPTPVTPVAPATKPATQPGDQLSPQAQAMTDALKQFPIALLGFSSQPDKYYALHLTALETSYRYGQPVLAMVSIRNTGEIDLPLDVLGPVQPTLVYGADAMGANLAPSRGFDELFGRLVLQPGDEIQQVVRLDQGPLGYYLRNWIKPQLVLITGEVYTNAVIGKDSDGKEKVDAGAGGQKAATGQLVGLKVPDLLDANARNQFYQDLQNGGPDVRIDSLDLLWEYDHWLRQERAQDPDSQRLAREFDTVIDHYSADPVGGVCAWSKYLAATAMRPESDKLIHALTTDKDWLARLLSLRAMRIEPLPFRRQIAEAMVKDSDATVKALADATLHRLGVATTQPTTEPGDVPTTGPADSLESP